jgi:hypothetical protein
MTIGRISIGLGCSNNLVKRKLLLFVAAELLFAAKAGFGQVWVPTSAPFTNWYCIAASGDGSKLGGRC